MVAEQRGSWRDGQMEALIDLLNDRSTGEISKQNQQIKRTEEWLPTFLAGSKRSKEMKRVAGAPERHRTCESKGDPLS